ncbi:hypothetical protein CRM22_006683 [Opisthorchis felineus]|uniref:Uncharacterized protein n=1 Tax=Opisthorchis felineus TaxID=147828 RepID=A0A4S2LJY0_OPIFE|nr:hypothetical protein CRM22_006683 [Opisthorchis felineus]
MTRYIIVAAIFLHSCLTYSNYEVDLLLLSDLTVQNTPGHLTWPSGVGNLDVWMKNAKGNQSPPFRASFPPDQATTEDQNFSQSLDMIGHSSAGKVGVSGHGLTRSRLMQINWVFTTSRLYADLLKIGSNFALTSLHTAMLGVPRSDTLLEPAHPKTGSIHHKHPRRYGGNFHPILKVG